VWTLPQRPQPRFPPVGSRHVRLVGAAQYSYTATTTRRRPVFGPAQWSYTSGSLPIDVRSLGASGEWSFRLLVTRRAFLGTIGLPGREGYLPLDVAQPTRPVEY
jgi:hypothetical protein